jgi:hypothetical protein
MHIKKQGSRIPGFEDSGEIISSLEPLNS